MPLADVENWDEDVDFQGDLFGTPLLATASNATPSISSRQSVRSESNADEEWQVLVAPNDETSASHAVTSAKQVGIPIPNNIPPSALLGGSIKRLGMKKDRRNAADDWSDDFGPAPSAFDGGLKLKLGDRSSNVSNVSINADDDFDSEWAEGSLGVRFGGTRHEHRGRSSSVSAMSPSLGSCMTFESEDDDLGGLVLPNEPINFEIKLKHRQEQEAKEQARAMTSAPQEPSPQPSPSPVPPPPSPPRAPVVEDDDFSAGLDFGAEVIDTKRKINRNVKIEVPKTTRPPSRTTSTTITFHERLGASRIPRPANLKGSKLDPVFESGGHNITRMNRAAPTTTSAQLLRSKRSAPVLSNRTPASLSNRPSIPFLPAGVSTSQSHHVATKSSGSHQRFPSDNSAHSMRPQSPLARSLSRMSIENVVDTPSRRHNPGQTQNHHAHGHAPLSLARNAATRPLNVKKTRTFGDGSELERFDDLPTSATKESKFLKEPANRTLPRTLRHASRSRIGLNTFNPPGAERAGTSPLPPTSHQPSGSLNLPSGSHTIKPVHAPKPYLAPPAERAGTSPLPPTSHQPSGSLNLTVGSQTVKALHPPRPYMAPKPVTPTLFAPASKPDTTPRFARDTAASRNAREQRLAAVSHSSLNGTRPRSGEPVSTTGINWKAQVAARSPHNSPTAARKKDVGVGGGPRKGPVLIRQMTGGVAKNEKGMTFNPLLGRWEGNDHALSGFDNPSTSTLPLHPTHGNNNAHHHHTHSTPSALTSALHTLPNYTAHHTAAPAPRQNNASPPRPALIAQVNGGSKGPRIERGMVFDPDRMKWLKVDARTMAAAAKGELAGISDGGFGGGPGSVSVEEEEDPFAGIEDLADEGASTGGGVALGEEKEWVGEEFDLGPTFIRRQRIEEGEWRRWTEGWFTGRTAGRGGESWRWDVRCVAGGVVKGF
ncbi:hypothetical protein EJ06DRAFT_584587 [Trichodelitschia bisporula]|uniref:Cytokinesis regulator n=1 Tax=Trichodelitschia bisporula TaxID=703511 RepID=A0A6G1HLZ2_9PEZI|nr:hypothetical protein EJ06DRAFT_584587 [Trichodelitschia bisporula]